MREPQHDDADASQPPVPPSEWSVEPVFDSGVYLTRIAVPTRSSTAALPDGDSSDDK